MKVNSNYYIYGRREDGAIITNMLEGSEKIYTKGSSTYIIANKILAACRKRSDDEENKNKVITRMLRMAGVAESDIASRLYDTNGSVKAANSDSTGDKAASGFDKRRAIAAIDRLMKFFTEFNFTPSFRFINSFAITSNPAEYVRNYFAVQDHSYAADIAEKIKSAEFNDIVKEIKLSNANPKPINTRFELYYGEPGTGKTTRALDITDSCIICSSDMLPADLMQNFVFKDGKADFDPSDLWIAMEQGKTITLDEVNMLPFESLRFLQGITDGKETFNYKGHTIKIHPNFKIYATMNLNVNGQCIPLPAPLVDRSYEIRKFVLSAKDLVAALI